jgi:hypothetical protein
MNRPSLYASKMVAVNRRFHALSCKVGFRAISGYFANCARIGFTGGRKHAGLAAVGVTKNCGRPPERECRQPKYLQSDSPPSSTHNSRKGGAQRENRASANKDVCRNERRSLAEPQKSAVPTVRRKRHGSTGIQFDVRKIPAKSEWSACLRECLVTTLTQFPGKKGKVKPSRDERESSAPTRFLGPALVRCWRRGALG